MKKFVLIDKDTSAKAIESAKADGYTPINRAAQKVIPKGSEVIEAKKKPGRKAGNGDDQSEGETSE